MSLEEKIFKGVTWLVFFKFFGQIFSWSSTIIVARILVPSDYALMEMATLITGYAAIFSTLGLGTAIIQRPSINQNEISSLFWFSMVITLILSLFCFCIAYPTAWIFSEPRIIPLTQSVSIVFFFAGLQIIPQNLLRRDMDFKSVGFITMFGVIASATTMLVLARYGAGVWALVGGHISSEAVKAVLFFLRLKWRPRFYFKISEVISYAKFGIIIASGGSLHYLHNKADRFFAGRNWQPTFLGYYSFALDLSKLPMDKIVTIINQVSFPAFAKVQSDTQHLRTLYLELVKITSIMVLPLYVGGFLVGDELIRCIMNEKWYPIIPIFRYLCLVQIMVLLNAFNFSIHNATGHPKRGFYFNMIAVLTLPVSFYFAVPFGLHAILLPWFTTFIVLSVCWLLFTLRKLEISILSYIANLYIPGIATLNMAVAVIGINEFILPFFVTTNYIWLSLALKIFFGGVCYVSTIFIADRQLLNSLRRLRAE